MRHLPRSTFVVAAAGLAASLSAVNTASAQFWPLETIVARFSPTGAAVVVPGLPADQYAAVTNANNSTIPAGTAVLTWATPFMNTPGLNTPPAIDSGGRVAFYGAIQPLSVTDNSAFPPVTQTVISTANQRAIFYGTSYATLQIVARDGDPNAAIPGEGGPTPGNVPTGWRLNSNTGGVGLNNTGVGLTSNGKLLLGSLMASAAGAPITATATNNAGFFVGAPGSINLTARRGDLAPDTAGVTGTSFSQNLNFNQAVAINPNGQVAFASTLTGGTGLFTSATPATQNDSGIFIGSPSGVTNVVRRGDVAPGTGGATFGTFTTNNATARGINASGGIVFTNNLSQNVGQGVPPATAQDSVLYYAPAGMAPQLVAQSGTAVGAALPGENYLNGATSGTPHISTTSSVVNSNGYVVYGAKFAPSAGITAGANDTAVMAWKYSASGNVTGDTNAIIARTGTTQVPGNSPGAVFSAVDFDATGNSNTRVNNNNSIFFRGTHKADGTLATPITAGVNDSGIFKFDATGVNTPAVIAQTGTVAPGAGGATYTGNLAILAWNNVDDVVFQARLSDTRLGLFAFVHGIGVQPVIFSGDTSIMGAMFPVGSASFGITSSSNGDGGSQSLTDNGWFAFNVTGTSAGGVTNSANVRVQIPAPGAASLCAVGGLVALRRRRRA